MGSGCSAGDGASAKGMASPRFAQSTAMYHVPALTDLAIALARLFVRRAVPADTALALPCLAPLAPEFTTVATRNFVRPCLHGRPNSAVAVNLERRVQNDRPRTSRTTAGYVENAISGNSESVAP
jgi:hypothetical protein